MCYTLRYLYVIEELVLRKGVSHDNLEYSSAAFFLWKRVATPGIYSRPHVLIHRLLLPVHRHATAAKPSFPLDRKLGSAQVRCGAWLLSHLQTVGMLIVTWVLRMVGKQVLIVQSKKEDFSRTVLIIPWCQMWLAHCWCTDYVFILLSSYMPVFHVLHPNWWLNLNWSEYPKYTLYWYNKSFL